MQLVRKGAVIACTNQTNTNAVIYTHPYTENAVPEVCMAIPDLADAWWDIKITSEGIVKEYYSDSKLEEVTPMRLQYRNESN